MSQHRNPRRRKPSARPLGSTRYREPFAAGIALAENPNRGKHHGAAATSRVEVAATDDRPARGNLTPHESRAIREGRTGYVPLTVRTPIRRARKAPHTTEYTI